MKHSKLLVLGLSATMMLGSVCTVFAADQTTADQPAQAVQTQIQNAAAAVKDTIDNIKLSLPEGFKPFDEEHVPDGTNAPENGEPHALTEEEIEKIKNGELPQEMPNGEAPADMQNGELPEIKEGEAPQMNSENLPEDFKAFDEDHVPDGTNAPENGELPELPSGETTEGEKPELPSGELPELPQQNDQNAPQMNSQAPQMNGQAPQMNGQAPQMNGQAPQMNGQAPQMNGQAPQENAASQNN